MPELIPPADFEDESLAIEEPGDQLSLLDLVSIVFTRRRVVLLSAVLGGVIAAVPVLTKPYEYKATASFMPQSSDAGKSGLAALAGSFGISVPTGNQAQSPQFYAELMSSRAVLAPISKDTFTVVELNGARHTVASLFELTGLSAERQRELSVEILAGSMRSDVNKVTGTVKITVTTPWRSVSLFLVDALIKQVNAFNLQTRQFQATDERRFVEGRLVIASESLKAAEDRMEQFLEGNRRILDAPQLTFARDRLQRDVMLNQQVAASLAQSLEDARIREVRDTPVISVLEPPMVQSTPESRGRLRRGIIGLLLGGLAGAILVVLSEMLARRRAAGDPQIERLVGMLAELKHDVARRVPVRFRKSAN